MRSRRLFAGGIFECGHAGRYWRVPLLPWRKPHWFCHHCGTRLS